MPRHVHMHIYRHPTMDTSQFTDNKLNHILIDNIFTNQLNPGVITGNITVIMSDHLPSFMITPKANQNHLPKKHNIHSRDLKKIDIENCMLHILAIDWNLIVVFDNANLSFNQFHDTVNQIIDNICP